MAADIETDVTSQARTRFSFRETLRRLAGKIPSSRSASRAASSIAPGEQSSFEPGSKHYKLPEKFELPRIDSGPSLSGLTMDLNKPLPATPENERRPSSTDIHDLAFKRILDEQSLSIAQARAKLENFDSSRPPGKPPVDMRSLRSQDGDVWGSVAPRAKSRRRNWQAEMPPTGRTGPAEASSSKSAQRSRSNSTSSAWSGETAFNASSMADRDSPQIGDSNLPQENSDGIVTFGTARKVIVISATEKPVLKELSAEIVSPAAAAEGSNFKHDSSAKNIQPEEGREARARPSVVELYPPSGHTRTTIR